MKINGILDYQNFKMTNQCPSTKKIKKEKKIN